MVSSTLNANDEKWGKQFAIDGKISSTSAGFYCSSLTDTAPWLQLKLVTPQTVSGLEVVNEGDPGWPGERLKMVEIRAGMEPVPDGKGMVPLKQNEKVAFFTGPGVRGKTHKIMFESPVRAQYITLQLTASKYLQINEVRVLAGKNRGHIFHLQLLGYMIIMYILNNN